ncbi:GNAT family N-acetyltransferase [Fructobacillus ficulneus]|uniref:Putative acetyltransferase, GNAT family n=1 Tax=Fructobacillus ficulneus TaxID=157463 RepID=A0A0K8MGD1_9LACO|nr:GNAT family N-acetyltransferase [Fructobacillus ficulneus]GAO99611.1 putative acetyltransferase, GNAT family [Fructobacillus ficulneus]
MKLRELTSNDNLAYQGYKNAWHEKMVPTSSFTILPFNEFLQKLEDDKTNKHGNFVPAKTLFLFDDDQIVGSIQIRYALTKNLMVEGGHIGYGVNPKYRGLGYGTKLLKFGLESLQQNNISTAVLTCDASNSNSRKIILTCNGVLDAQYTINHSAKERYLIYLN